MKRALAVILAVVLVSAGMLTVSAAQQKKIVYVSSQAVPKAAAEFARDWFANRMPAQDICDQTELTIDQVKQTKLCRAFTVEPYGTDATKRYYFPLIYKDAFVAVLEVSWQSAPGGDSGYFCRVDGGSGNPFVKALNTLSSSVSSPMLFVVTKDAYFALDSKNKATALQEFIPSSADEIAKQKRAVSKMKRPSRVVSVSADVAYPERISSRQIADETPVVTVENKADYTLYRSNDGGKLWKPERPPVYISLDRTYYPLKDGKIPYTVHNRTSKEMGTDVYFDLLKWDGREWGPCPGLVGKLEFIDIGVILPPNSTANLDASWGASGIELEAGRYKLVKNLGAGNRKFTCEAVFCLE